MDIDELRRQADEARAALDAHLPVCVEQGKFPHQNCADDDATMCEVGGELVVEANFAAGRLRDALGVQEANHG